METPTTAGPYADALSDAAFQVRMNLEEALDGLAALPEEERVGVLLSGPLERLLALIAPAYSTDHRESEWVYDYLLRHKQGLALLAQIRMAISHTYSIPGRVGTQQVYVSPDSRQWFEDGVMFVQGEEQFAGFLGLYKNGRVSFAVSARDVLQGETLGPEDLRYLEIEEYQQLARDRFRASPTEIDSAVDELRAVLRNSEQSELSYHQYLERHPWVLGGEYGQVDSHARFDDRNIPDFSAVRLRDASRDIIEIKSPALNLFTADGHFTAEMNAAWDQIERYLDFARRDADYLMRRGLRFDNPRCYLIAGRGLSQDQLHLVRRKERMNPSVTFLSFEDLLMFVEQTAALLKRLQSGLNEAEA